MSWPKSNWVAYTGLGLVVQYCHIPRLLIGYYGRAKCQLSALHEIGHLQALPFELLYTLVMLGIFILNDTHITVWTVLIIVAGSFAAWEISAEIYTIKSARPSYGSSYQGISLVPRILFWTITVTLVVASWIAVLF